MPCIQTVSFLNVLNIDGHSIASLLEELFLALALKLPQFVQHFHLTLGATGHQVCGLG